MHSAFLPRRKATDVIYSACAQCGGPAGLLQLLGLCRANESAVGGHRKSRSSQAFTAAQLSHDVALWLIFDVYFLCVIIYFISGFHYGWPAAESFGVVTAELQYRPLAVYGGYRFKWPPRHQEAEKAP